MAPKGRARANAQDQKRARPFADERRPYDPVFCILMLARLLRSEHDL